MWRATSIKAHALKVSGAIKNSYQQAISLLHKPVLRYVYGSELSGIQRSKLGAFNGRAFNYFKPRITASVNWKFDADPPTSPVSDLPSRYTA
jgi:hypothetical protein